MTLRLVGAGLPRTGTTSLRDALHQLLDAPIYHMSEALARPEHTSTWVEAIAGQPPIWDDFLAGYAGGVDTPFSTCWRELAAAYPQAPVLLSHRGSAEVWHRSMEATVLPRTRGVLSRADGDDPTLPLFQAIFARTFSALDDPADLIAGYERRLREVRSEIEPSRLVEWQPEDGWAPICRALGVPVPDAPFPYKNTTAEYRVRAEARARQS